MSKKSPMLIYNIEGDVDTCYECFKCRFGGICTNEHLYKDCVDDETDLHARMKNRADGGHMCQREKKPVAYVVHYNMSPTDKEDKKEFKGAVSKGMERFLCRKCFRANWRDNPMRFSQGQSEFTDVTIEVWKKIAYHYK